MRIHSDVLTYVDMARAATSVEAHTGSTVDFLRFDRHGSRKRSRAFEIQLRSDGRLTHRHTMNDCNAYAATWDQWGWFIAHLFSVDPDAIVGPYNGLDDFNWQTDDKFTLTANQV